jgi:Tol biopolymer transport system component
MSSRSICPSPRPHRSTPSFHRAAWLGVSLALAAFQSGRAAEIELVSKPASGAHEDADSLHGAISADGRFVAFLSVATNLVAGQVDNNTTANDLGSDVFLYDAETKTNVLVSHAAGSPTTAGDGVTRDYPALSADGRYVAFPSNARNLVPGQIDGVDTSDVFLFDRETGSITLVSHASGSATTVGNGESDQPAISADGRYVAYQSYASDLVAGVSDPLGGSHDIFLYDRVTGTTTLVSHSAASASATGNHHSVHPSLNADGRFVVFASYATNLVPGQIDSNADYDIFLFDRVEGTMTLVSRVSGSAATAGNDLSPIASLSGDGSYIVFESGATNLVPGQQDNPFYDVFLYERATGSLRLVSGRQGSTTQTAGGYFADLSADGRFVVFQSGAPDLVPGQVDQNNSLFTNQDVFLFDRVTSSLSLVSHSYASPTATGTHQSTSPAISADGRYVGYLSGARDLVPGMAPSSFADENVYRFDRLTGVTTLVSRSATGVEATGAYNAPALSNDGDAVVFTTRNALVPDDSSALDVYLWTDAPAGRDFYTLAPCRVYDSRDGGPALTSGVPQILGLHGFCDIPDTATAVIANVTVVGPTGAGHLILHRGDSSAPQASTINFSAGQTRANNAVFPLSTDGLLTVTPFVTGNGSVHYLIDVMGYYQQ